MNMLTPQQQLTKGMNYVRQAAARGFDIWAILSVQCMLYDMDLTKLKFHQIWRNL